MKRTAKIFLTNRSRAVRLPKDFQFRTQKFLIGKEREEVILSPRPADWWDHLAHARMASPDFMENVEDLPVQER